MPFTAHVDNERHIVVSNWTGHVGIADVVAYFDWIDRRLPAGWPYHEWIDFSAAVSLTLPEHDMRDVVQCDAFHAPSRRGHRSIFITSDPDIAAVLRAFIAASADIDAESMIVPDHASAEAALAGLAGGDTFGD